MSNLFENALIKAIKNYKFYSMNFNTKEGFEELANHFNSLGYSISRGYGKNFYSISF